MTGLPFALQAMVWLYALIAGGAVLTCLWTMYAGLATGRHRRSRWAAWRALGARIVDVAEFALYGRAA